MNPWQGYEISLSNAHSLRYVSHLSLQQAFASTDTQESENAKEPLANRRLQPQKPYNRKKHRDWKKKCFFSKNAFFQQKTIFTKFQRFFFVFDFFSKYLLGQNPVGNITSSPGNSVQLRSTPGNPWDALILKTAWSSTLG